MRELGLFLILLCSCATHLGGGDGGLGDCSSHTDSPSCSADPACFELTCPSCSGPTIFAGCYSKSTPPPGIQCSTNCIPSCHTLSASDCTAQAARGCHPFGCCQSFEQCLDPGETRVCNIACPAPIACNLLTTLADCQQRSDCHALYQSGLCGCASCCCMVFGSCGVGAKANCAGPISCRSAPPDCNTTPCSGQYVLAYANNCYDGCVLQSECQ